MPDPSTGTTLTAGSDFDAGTGLRGYGRVLTHGAAIRPFAAAVLARLPIGMTGFGMVMVIQQVRGNYSLGGIVTGAFALATAVGAPVWGRLMDRHGQPRILVPTSVISGIAIAAVSVAAVAEVSAAMMIGLAVIAGIFFPPVSPAMRAAWRVIFSHTSSRKLGYALDAVAVELIFVMGPLLLSLLTALTPPQVPLIAAAVFLVAGTLLYSSTQAARGSLLLVGRPVVDDDPTPSPVPGKVANHVVAQPSRRAAAALRLRQRSAGRPRSGSAMAAPGIAAVLVVSLLMAVGFGQMDTSIIATAEVVLGSTAKLGFLFMFIAGGSALGGIVYGSREWPGSDPQRLVLLLAVFSGSLVPWPFLLALDEPPLPVLFGLLFLTGLTIAPALIIFQGLLDLLSPPHQMTETQSLLSASQTTGAALGSAIGGFTIDAWGAPGGIAGAAMVIGAGAVVAAFVRTSWYARADGGGRR